MKLTIFGASGGIGRILVQKALDEGHEVTAYVRKADGFSISDPSLHIIQGELSESKKLNKAVSEADAVVSTLGPPLKFSYPGMPIAEGHKHIVQAMETNKVKRFVTIATPSIKFEKDKRSLTTVLPRIMARIIFPKPYKEIITLGEIVTHSSLDWTIVRFIAPNDTAETRKIKVTFGREKINMSISRSDIAGFILQELKNNEYIHSMPIIGG